MLDKIPFVVHDKLKSRGRKGIPDSYRGFAWHLLTDRRSNEIMEKHSVDKLMQNLMQQEGNKHILIDIHKDVSRTLPNHVYFQQKFIHGQKDLFCVLKCLSIVEP
jgi:hypothetical protein